RAGKLFERDGFYEQVVHPKVIGVNLDFRIERRCIEALARLAVKSAGMGRVVVYEMAEKKPRLPLVEHFGRKQVVCQGLKRAHGAAQDLQRPLCLRRHMSAAYCSERSKF